MKTLLFFVILFTKNELKMMRKNTLNILLFIIIIIFLQVDNSWSQSCTGGLNVAIEGASTKDKITTSVNVSNIKCTDAADGAINLSAAGGNQNFTYQWSNNATTSSLTGLTVGSYTVTVTDADDCTSTTSIDIDYLSPSATNIADENSCGSCVLGDGKSSYFFNSQHEYLGSISDEAVNEKALDNTQICVQLDATVKDCGGTPYLPRQWKVNVTQKDNACVKLYFTESELTALLNASSYSDIPTLVDNMCVTAFEGGDESCSSNLTATLYTASDGLTFSKNDPAVGVWSMNVCVGRFSTFFAHVCNADGSVLPVELIDFVGWHSKGSNFLKWNTASEENTSHFEVERSTDNGQTFKAIGEVMAFGTTTETQVYNFEDEDPAPGKNYYRLRIVDYDDTYEYSKIVMLYAHDVQNYIQAYPNPFNNNFTLVIQEADEGDAAIEIFDVAGRKVYEKFVSLEETQSTFPISLDKLAVGNYWVKVTFANDADNYKVIQVNKSI